MQALWYRMRVNRVSLIVVSWAAMCLAWALLLEGSPFRALLFAVLAVPPAYVAVYGLRRP